MLYRRNKSAPRCFDLRSKTAGAGKSVLIAVFAAVSAGSFCFAAELDKKRYIPVSEVKAGMKGYCLTCMKDTEVGKFNLEVLSIIHNLNPGRDTILVKCTDEQFLYAGVIAGCSGSPVYIDGRLAGAMSFGWPGSKDPIYGVTPIEDMLATGQADSYQTNQTTGNSAVSFDFSKPINLFEVNNLPLRLSTQVEAAGQLQTFADSKRNTNVGMQPLPTPLFISGLSKADKYLSMPLQILLFCRETATPKCLLHQHPSSADTR